MQIRVKTLDGRDDTIEIEPEETVQQLRDRVVEKLSLTEDRVRLIFQGKALLENGRAVSTYGLQDGLVLHVVERPPDVEPLPPDAHDDAHDDFHNWGMNANAHIQGVVSAMNDARRSLGHALLSHDSLMANSAFAVVRQSPFVDRSYTEQVVRAALNQMTYVPEEIRNQFAIEWRDNSIVVRLPQLTNPNIASPAMERLHVAEMALNNVGHLRNIARGENGLMARVERILNGEAVDNEEYATEAVNIAVQLETMPETAPRRGGHDRPERFSQTERDRRFEVNQRSNRSEGFTMRHILSSDIAEVVGRLQEETSLLQPYVALYQRVLLHEGDFNQQSDILQNGSASILCVFMEHVQRALHRLSHALHTMSDLNIHIDDAHPRRAYPQYGHFHVNGLTEGEIVIDLIDPASASTAIARTRPAGEMFHLPVPVNDVRLTPEGVTPLTTLYPTGIVQHMATVTFPLVGASGAPPAAVVSSPQLSFNNANAGSTPFRGASVEMNPGNALRDGLRALLNGSRQAGGRPVFSSRPIPTGTLISTPPALRRGAVPIGMPRGSSQPVVGIPLISQPSSGQSVIGINRPPPIPTATLIRPPSAPPTAVGTPEALRRPNTREILAAVRAVDTGTSSGVNFESAFAGLVGIIREGHINIAQSIVRGNSAVADPLFPGLHSPAPAPLGDFARQAAQAIFGSHTPVGGVRIQLHGETPPSRNGRPQSRTPAPAPAPPPCPHAAMRQVNQVAEALSSEMTRASQRLQEVERRVTDFRQRIINRRESMAANALPPLPPPPPVNFPPAPEPHRLPAGTTINEQLIPIDPFLQCQSRFTRQRNRTQTSHYLELVGSRMPRRSARRDPPPEFANFNIPLNGSGQVVLTEGQAEQQLSTLVQLAVRSVLSMMREQDAERTARSAGPVNAVLQGLGINQAEVSDEIHLAVHIDGQEEGIESYPEPHQAAPVLQQEDTDDDFAPLETDAEQQDFEVIVDTLTTEGQEPSTSADLCSPQPKKRKTEVHNGASLRDRRRLLPLSLQSVIDHDSSNSSVMPAQTSPSDGYVLGLPVHLRTGTSSTGFAVPIALREVLDALNRLHVTS